MAEQDDPSEALRALAGSTAPFVIGVRHHSPACAAAMGPLLDAFRPSHILLELPAEMQRWIEWLGHPDLVSPVALAATAKAGGDLFFYPFADFSPELAAIRWAKRHGVPVEAFDLPAGAREGRAERRLPEGPSLVAALLAQHETDDAESLWDRMIEVRAQREEPEATRRAALLYGWALRVDEAMRGGPSAVDLRREAFMRARLARATGRVAAVVGAFHAGALVDPPIPVPVPAAEPTEVREVVTSLVPYAFELLDSRSGYPAGIRDPRWQQRAFEVLRDGGDLDDVVAESATAIARAVRQRGHVASVPDAAEATRVARDVASLRGLAGPGRRELLEAIESAYAQGELFGRGRVVARALEEVLVGRARGKLPPGAPRSGLVPHAIDLLAKLKLPGPPGGEPRTLDLDPLRSPLDRARQVALERLRACGVVYAVLDARTGFAGELLTTRWSVDWTPSTDATLEVAGILGVTLEQAARGALLQAESKAERDDRASAAERIRGIRAAAVCGLADLTEARLVAFVKSGLLDVGLAEAIEALGLVEAIARGQVPGLAIEPEEGAVPFELPKDVRISDFVAAAVRAVEGLTGSTRIEDARALLEIVGLHERQGDDVLALGDGRLGYALDVLALEGSPLMQGAGGAARVLLGRADGDGFGLRMGSFVDLGGSDLEGRVRGALVMALPLFEVFPAFLERLLDRIEALDDRAFLTRLPSLRRGFDVLTPAARQRLLDVIAARIQDDAGELSRDLALEADPLLVARAAAADLAGRRAVEALGLPWPVPSPPASAVTPAKHVGRADTSISLRDRIRLILGRERDRLGGGARRYATALDELYGRGRGEGERTMDDRAGTDAPFPTVREWSNELDALFGKEVREEVLGQAAAAGRPAAALALDPDTVTPSIELLEHVLSLKGGLAESDLARLRRLVKRIVDALVEALARRLAPAITGLSTHRPTRRPVGPLDLRRTVLANLKTARRRDDGSVAIAAERFTFRARAKRSLDWHLILVVDVSGSMDQSVIHSAMMAAILNALPALTVHFVAFSTEVLDLSGRVDDPLGLLLELSVGGGTDIGKGLRYARSLLKVPSRSLVVVLSDFEEGVSAARVVSEVRALVESGAKALGLAALDDRGAPRYARALAETLVSAGMPIAALTPLELARWVAEQIR